MKKKSIIVFSVLMIFLNTDIFAQTRDDTLIALNISKRVPNNNPLIWFTFDVDKLDVSAERMLLLEHLIADTGFLRIRKKVKIECNIDLLEELNPKVVMRLIPSDLIPNVSAPRLQIIENILNKTKPSLNPLSGYDLKVSKTDQVTFIDYEEEDGDKISVLFDGKRIQSSMSIENEPFDIPVESNVKIIQIIADDEGKLIPCTLKVIVNKVPYYFLLKKGESIKILRQ